MKYLHPIVAVLRPILNSLRQLRDEWMTNNGNTGQIPGYSAASVPATVTVLTANQLCCLLCLGKQPAATRCALVGAKHTQMVTETQWTIRTGWRFQKGWTNTSQWDGYNVCSLKTKKSNFMARKMKVMCFFLLLSVFHSRRIENVWKHHRSHRLRRLSSVYKLWQVFADEKRRGASWEHPECIAARISK